jgi:PAS domain S-box-containing protein
MSERAQPLILVVDDNAAGLYATVRMLKSAGFDTIEATTGQQALEFAERDPDAIVLDINLPDIDGYEVCRILRRRPMTARTPIIHLSATFVEDQDKVHGLDVGADGYLTHPVEATVLNATVRAFVRARQAEEGMRRSEETFRAVFERALNGIALVGEDLRLIRVNPAAARLLGGKPDELEGRPSLDFVAPGHQAEAQAFWERCRLQGEGVAVAPMVTVTGKPLEVEWNVSRHVDPGVWLAVLNDITAKVALERERERLLAAERAARAEAERSSRIKDQFLAVVSHELRSPLQAILGGAQVLRLKSRDGAVADARPLEIIERNARRQASLIADLLDVARINSGKLRLTPEPLDLVDAVGEAVEAVRRAATAKSLAVDVALPAEPVPIRADPARLEQILQNILGNAVKFTPPGGRVDVQVTTASGMAEVKVVDTGQGINPDFLPHLFETFRQEQAGNARSFGGLGLGLAIVKRLVQLHGGTVTATSEGEHRGATFIIRLPLAGAASELRSPASTKAAPVLPADALQGLTVLVVDDDPDARLIVSRILRDYRVQVIEATSGAEARAALDRATPDVLLSDISMPTEDGYAMMRRIRAAGFDADVLPAIALTAFARPEDESSILQSGFQLHLAKPVDVEALVNAIASVAAAASGPTKRTTATPGPK